MAEIPARQHSADVVCNKLATLNYRPHKTKEFYMLDFSSEKNFELSIAYGGATKLFGDLEGMILYAESLPDNECKIVTDTYTELCMWAAENPEIANLQHTTNKCGNG